MDAILKTEGAYYFGTITDDLSVFSSMKRIYGLKEYKEKGFISLNSFLRKLKRLKDEDSILEKLNGEKLYLFPSSDLFDKLDKFNVKRGNIKKVEKRKKISQKIKIEKYKNKKAKECVENPYSRDIEIMQQYGNNICIKCLQCDKECKKSWDKKVTVCREFTILSNGYIDLKNKGYVNASSSKRKLFAIEFYKFCDEFFDEKLWPNKTNYKEMIRIVMPRQSQSENTGLIENE